MKNLKLLFMVLFLLLIFISTNSFAQDTSEFRPTQPPRIPVTDYDTGSHRIMDFLYMHYSFEEFDLDGGGLGYNYVDSFDQAGYNLGIGFLYMQGSSSSLPEDLDIYVWNLPLNANLGFRIAGSPDSNSLMIFGGLQWMYMWLDASYGEIDVYVYGPAYGPVAGFKGEIKVTPSVSFIPYYIFQHTMFDLTVEVEGYEQDVDIDPVTSHLLGFDIQFGEFSVGALLDMLNNTDNDKITIFFSYDFDYKSETEDLNRDEEEENTKKPARKQKR
ncbi:MAG TPA: hypothetical protein PK358_13955 [Spirochaetota bacterium]|nr:hypothetical protein [Spirochaetota bacterium]HPJ35938.1 hypothetical protein [Spirochaetota bacterium]